MEDVVTAKLDYSRLDRAESTARIRLNSTAVQVKHRGEPSSAADVDVVYVTAGKAYRVRGKSVVLACYNAAIPFLCPEMPETQRKALAYGVKTPLVYTNVAIRNWTSFQKLGVERIYYPGGYHSSASLDFPVSLGSYRHPRSPEEPMVLHLVRFFVTPGRPLREQHQLGKYDLLQTSFETFERSIRDQLGRSLSGGGFDPARDIEAITVNRWPHGYAYGYTALTDPEFADGERPNVVGRQRFGRIHVANSDAAASAYTHAAIDEAHRAVSEIVGSRESENAF
jgi:spermidine dehydrogenase